VLIVWLAKAVVGQWWSGHIDDMLARSNGEGGIGKGGETNM